MRDILIAAAAIVVSFIIVAVLARAYLREDKGKHGENMNAINKHPLVTEDTEQLSFYDRAVYIETQERLANSGEHALFIISEEQWAEDIQEIFRDSAQIDAVLNSGLLAFPEWTDAEFPHNEVDWQCPGPGIKCMCWDIAHLGVNWEGIAA